MQKGEKRMIETAHGHVVFMSDGSAIATSPMVADDIVNTLITLINAISKDLSDLTGIPQENLLEDYYEECEIDLMHAAFNAVLRKHGHEVMKTPTRIIIEEKLKEEKENVRTAEISE